MNLSVANPTSFHGPELSNDRQAAVENGQRSPFIRSSPADSGGHARGNHRLQGAAHEAWLAKHHVIAGFARPPLPYGGINRHYPGAAKVSHVPHLSDTQLNAMGREILALYKQKVIGQNARYLNFKSEGLEYSIRGCNGNDVLIHTKNGVITLGPHGKPRSHYHNQIGADEATLALMRTLSTLRNHTPPAQQRPAGMAAA